MHAVKELDFESPQTSQHIIIVRYSIDAALEGDEQEYDQE